MNGTIVIPVDATNPGQFFACCGLLELAARLWDGAQACFAPGHFEIVGVAKAEGAQDLITRLKSVGLTGALTPDLAEERKGLEADYKEAKKKGEALSADRESRRKYLGGLLRAGWIQVGEPFVLTLDWWQEESDEVPKTWAGSMQVRRVAMAALNECEGAFKEPTPFDYSCVLRPADVCDGNDEGDEKSGSTEDDEGKAEPFYFDSTRGTNATPVDIGFSPNKLSVERATATKNGKAKTKRVKMESGAFPAVEFLALVGLQRFRPAPTGTPRVFDYWTWNVPLPPALAAAAVCGMLPCVSGDRYRFENGFRTDQRKHKGFLAATRISEGVTQ